MGGQVDDMVMMGWGVAGRPTAAFVVVLVAMGAAAVVRVVRARHEGKAGDGCAAPHALSVSRRLLAGKVVILTGGASGIGMATALTMATHGAKVLVMDIRTAPLEGGATLETQWRQSQANKVEREREREYLSRPT